MAMAKCYSVKRPSLTFLANLKEIPEKLMPYVTEPCLSLIAKKNLPSAEKQFEVLYRTFALVPSEPNFRFLEAPAPLEGTSATNDKGTTPGDDDSNAGGNGSTKENQNSDADMAKEVGELKLHAGDNSHFESRNERISPVEESGDDDDDDDNDEESSYGYAVNESQPLW